MVICDSQQLIGIHAAIMPSRLRVGQGSALHGGRTANPIIQTPKRLNEYPLSRQILNDCLWPISGIMHSPYRNAAAHNLKSTTEY